MADNVKKMKKKSSIFGKVFGRKGKKDKKEEAQSGAESGVDDSTAAASAASGADTPKEGGARSPSPNGSKTAPKTWRGSQNGDEDDAEGGGGADGEVPGTPQDDKKDKKKDKKGGRAKEDKKDGTRRAKTDKKDKKSTSKTKRDDSLRNLQLQGQEVDPDDPDFQAFAGFDTDCSGSISELELGELLKIAGLEVDDEQLEEILKSADTDANGVLSFPEFKALMVRCRSGDLITGGGGGGGDGDASPQSPQKEKSKKSKKSSSKKDGAKDKDKRSKRRQKTAGGSIDGDAEEAAADASAQVASPRKARRKETDSGAEEAAPRLTAEALQAAAQAAESDAGGWDDDDELVGANGGAGGGGGGGGGADAPGAAASGRERSGKRGGGGGGGGANKATVATGVLGLATAASAMDEAPDPIDPNDPDFRIWSTIDADGGGTVTTEELGELFSSAGLDLTATQTITIARNADRDGSGRLDFKEFKSLLVRCREGGVDAMLRPPTPQEKLQQQQQQQQQQQEEQQRAATPPRAGDKISRMDSNASSSSAGGARSAGGKSKISRMDSSRSSVASGAGTSVAGASVMGGGGADSLAAMTIEDFAKQHHLSKYAEALRKLSVALDALCRMAEEEVGELLKGATDPPIALGGRHRIILALSKHRKALEAEAEKARRVGGGAGAPKRMGRGGSSRSVVSSSGTSVAGGAGGTAAFSSAGGAPSVNGSASVKSFGASGASVSGASGSFSKAGSVVSGGAVEDEAAALLSKSGAQSPGSAAGRPPRKNRKKGSLAASLTSSKTSSVDGGVAAASKPASGLAVADALASTEHRPRRRTSLSSVASDQSAGRDDARSSAGSGLSDAEPTGPEAETATARTRARGARTVRKKAEVSDVQGSGGGGGGGGSAPAPAPPMKVHVPPSLRQRLTRIFRAFDVLGTDAMATDDLPAALQQCFDCHNAEDVPLAQKQVREAAAAASGGHGGADKDKAGGIAAAITRVSAVTAQAAAVGAVVAPSDEEIATLLSETRLVPQEKSGKGLHALGLSLTLPQVLMLSDRWYSARGAVVLAARRKKLASEQERRRGSIGRGGGMKKLGPGTGPRSRPSVGTHLGLDPEAHAALMASASAAGHEVGEDGAGGEEGGGGKTRKKSLAAVDHYELLKQLALSGCDSALEPEHEDKLDVSFTVADEPKFSLAGHLARKDHARRDKGEAAAVGGAGERGAEEAALIFTEDLPNYALEAAAAAPHTGRRMTRYGRGGKEGARGRPTDAELLAELDTGEAGAPGARKPRSGSMGSVAESGSGLGGETAGVAAASDAEFERAARGAFRSFAVQGRGGAASGIGAATLYDALRSLGCPPSATELRTLVAGVGSGGVISAAGFVQIAQQQRAAAMDAVVPLRGRKVTSSPGRNGPRALGASGSVVGGESELGEPKKSRRDSNGSLRSSIRPSRRASGTEGAGARARRRTSNSSSAVHFGGKASSVQDDGDSMAGSALSAARRAATHNVSEEDRPLFEVFRAYDEDGSGSVDAEELMKALRKAGYTPTEEQVYSLMEEVDKDGSGECEWAEFKQLVAALKMRRDQFIQRGVSASMDGGEQPAADEKALADGSAPAVVVNKRGRRTRKGRPTQAQKDSAVVVQSRMRGFLDRKRVQQVKQHRSEQMALALQEYRTCVTGILLGSTIDERARGFVRQQQLDRKITEDQHAHVLEKLGWTIAEFEAGGKGRGGNANANANDANSDDPDWQMWVEFDEGGSDAVAKDELADLFNAAGTNLDAAQLKIVHNAAEKDGGVLCFKDFKALVVACREGGTDALLRAADPAAAAVVDAAAAAEDEEFAPLKVWLIEQGLEKNFDALKESEMSLEGLLDMDGDELTEFLVEIKVPAGARKRLKLAVKHSVEANKGAKVLDDWLSEHNLTKFTAQIKASEMTLDSLLEMEPSDFKDYAQELGLTAGVRMRFAKALAKTTRTASPVDSKGTPPAADARLLPEAGAQGLRQSDSPVADGSPGAPSKATVLTSFKGTLSAILVNKSLTTEQVAFVTSYRLKHGITETEMTSVIADLGWTMERYAKLEKSAKAAPLTKMGQSTRSVVESEKGDGDAEEAEAKKTSRWGSSTAKKKKEPAKPAAKAAAADENPRAIVLATLGTGPLGITLNKNNSAAPAASPDISAVVDEVSGAAERTGKIKPGQFLAVINQEPASGLDFDATHKALAAASRPLTLLLSNPAKPDDPELFPCYAADDPTGKFPEKIGLYLHAEGSVEDYGLQVFEPTSGKTICFWTWPMIIDCERKMQSDDPDDMELLFVSIKALGTFSFEANSMLEFYLDLEKRLAIHPHASADALPVPGGSPSSGSTAAKDLGVYTVTLGAGPMGLSIEQNTHGPDISAIIDGVSGASLKTGKMAIGHMLVSVNGASMTDFSFVEVLEEIKSASRPVELVFVSPPSLDNPDLFDCYTADDPTGGFPEAVKLLIRGDHGLQIIDARAGATVAYFPWQMLPQCHCERQQSKDEMQLMMLDTNVGTIVFEANETAAFANLVQKQIDAALGARRMSRVVRRGGMAGGRDALGVHNSIVEVQLSEAALGLSLEPNPFGPDQSAVVEELLAGGQAEMTGEIKCGQYLISINKKSTLRMPYNRTMDALRNAERPLLLTLVNPISRADRSPDSRVPHAFPVKDPTGDFPEECVFQLLDEGLHVGDATNGATVCFLEWDMIEQWKPAEQEQGMMELFMLAITGMGIFSFELNDAYAFSAELQERMQDHAEETTLQKEGLTGNASDDDIGDRY